MSLEQIERLAESTPAFRQLVLTGGEPMLRKDIAEIFAAFACRQKAQTILINTNGLKPAKIVEVAEQVKTEFPGTGLDFQISLDGMRDTHDRIRGVPGNFDKAIETLRAISELGEKYPALTCHALTVITDLNYKELVALNDTLRERVSENIVHGFEMVRDVETTAWGIPPEIAEQGVGPKAMSPPPIEAFSQLAEDLKTINRRGPYRANAFHIHNLAQMEMIRTQKEQYPCVTAGQAVGVVYSNGDVAHCEFTLPFANLADFDFDFQKLWHSDAANERREGIKKCYCIHGCFHGKAVEYSLKGIAAMTKAAW